MGWQYDPYILLLFIAAAITGLLAYLVFKRRHSPGAMPLLILTIGAFVWSFGYAFELGTTAQSIKILWAKAQYPGIVTIPSAWLATTLDYTGRRRWLAPRYLPFWAIVPVATLLLALTNEAHGLIWSNVSLISSGSLLVLDLEHGGAFWVYSVYSYVLLALGTVVLAEVLLPSLRLYWEQAIALLISVLSPWLASLAFLTDVNPVRPLDPVPVAFILSSLALFWAIARFRFLDIGPVARNIVFAGIPAGVFVLDAQDRIVDCNPEAMRMTGASVKQAIGKPFRQVWPGDFDSLHFQAEAMPEYQEINIEHGTERRIYSMAMWPLIGGSGHLIGRILLFQDATNRKQLEDKLFQAEKLNEMGLIAAGAAHELNNPLGVILNLTEVLMKSVQDQQSRADLQVIYEEAERSIHIVRGLLSFARQSAPVKSFLSINDVLERVMELRSHAMNQHDIDLDKQLQPDLPEAMADASQMAQVFTNIAMNAEQAMFAAHGHGTLRIMTRHVGDAIQITFEDDGPGIPSEHLSKVFVPFFTTKKPGEGTGLGLSACDGIIKRHGGNIQVESEAGRGVKFTVVIPLLDRHPENF